MEILLNRNSPNCTVYMFACFLQNKCSAAEGCQRATDSRETIRKFQFLINQTDSQPTSSGGSQLVTVYNDFDSY